MVKETIYAIKLKNGLYAKEKVLGKDVYIYGATLLNAITFETEEAAQHLVSAIMNNDDNYFNFVTDQKIEAVVKFEINESLSLAV